MTFRGKQSTPLKLSFLIFRFAPHVANSAYCALVVLVAILCVRSSLLTIFAGGVGKSSLINRVFGITEAVGSRILPLSPDR